MSLFLFPNHFQTFPLILSSLIFAYHYKSALDSSNNQLTSRLEACLYPCRCLYLTPFRQPRFDTQKFWKSIKFSFVSIIFGHFLPMSNIFERILRNLPIEPRPLKDFRLFFTEDRSNDKRTFKHITFFRENVSFFMSARSSIHMHFLRS